MPEDDGRCFVCGKNNKEGLGLDFVSREGKVTAEFTPKSEHQGFKDIVHGGIISAVLDEAMVKAVLFQGRTAVTAEMTVRFRASLAPGEKSVVEAEAADTAGRLIRASSRLRKTDGSVVAEATAKLLRHG